MGQIISLILGLSLAAVSLFIYFRDREIVFLLLAGLASAKAAFFLLGFVRSSSSILVIQQIAVYRSPLLLLLFVLFGYPLALAMILMTNDSKSEQS